MARKKKEIEPVFVPTQNKKSIEVKKDFIEKKIHYQIEVMKILLMFAILVFMSYFFISLFNLIMFWNISPILCLIFEVVISILFAIPMYLVIKHSKPIFESVD